MILEGLFACRLFAPSHKSSNEANRHRFEDYLAHSIPGVELKLIQPIRRAHRGIFSRRKHSGPVDVNMNKMPDVAMALVVVALYADGPTPIRDMASWRVRETERMITICTTKKDYIAHGTIIHLGATVEEGAYYCVITPPEKLNVTAIDTYDDHRMAMAFSLAACADVPVTIMD